MSYTVRTNPDKPVDQWADGYNRPRHQSPPRDATIVLVGCGGTGGFLATAITRLLIGRNAHLFLVDPDRVETSNLGRQNFEPSDLGRFKAEVLAERLARIFDRPISYSVQPYDQRIHSFAFDHPANLQLVVGAVDNAAARRAIAETLGEDDHRAPWNVFWLDCGNGFSSGQVLLGNCLKAEEFKNAFDPSDNACSALPAPGLQRPDLLESPPQPVPTDDLNCAVAVERAEQSPTINQMMAACAATYVEKLLAGTCSWMATYLDMEVGSLQTVSADPRHVARIIGQPTRFLVKRMTPTVPHQALIEQEVA